jgi:KTSC domain
VALDLFDFPGSSNLLGGTYDPETEELTVTFSGGEQYRGKVPQGVVEGLKAAGSAGGYYHREIRTSYMMRPV